MVELPIKSDLHWRVVFVDADNTLWNTDGVFASAQLRLLDRVQGILGRTAATDGQLEFVRRADQALAERHHLGLRYPPHLLALAVARAINGEEVELAARAVWKGAGAPGLLSAQDASAIEAEFIAEVRRLPSLLPGVEIGLKRLHASGALILVVTEGSRNRILRAASKHGLSSVFDRIIEAPKTTRLYERVLRLAGKPTLAYMIGDQLQRDVAPAKAAGLTTIYVPGGFRPRWEPNVTIVQPDYRVDRFDEAVTIILEGRSCI